MAGVLDNMACVAFLRGRHQESVALYERSLTLWREVSDDAGRRSRAGTSISVPPQRMRDHSAAAA